MLDQHHVGLTCGDNMEEESVPHSLPFLLLNSMGRWAIGEPILWFRMGRSVRLLGRRRSSLVVIVRQPPLFQPVS